MRKMRDLDVDTWGTDARVTVQCKWMVDGTWKRWGHSDVRHETRKQRIDRNMYREDI